MKPISTFAFLAVTVSSCATAPIATTVQSSETPKGGAQAAHSGAAPATDTVRARKIEIVDGLGRPRIVMGTDDEPGISSLSFLDPSGEQMWSATQYDDLPHAGGQDKSGPAFIIQAEAGEEGSLYSLFVTPRGCALHMGSYATDNEGGIGLGYMDGESFVRISAPHARDGEPDTTELRLSLVKDRLVIRDMSGMELMSLPVPVFDEDQDEVASPSQGTLQAEITVPAEKAKK